MTPQEIRDEFERQRRAAYVRAIRARVDLADVERAVDRALVGKRAAVRVTAETGNGWPQLGELPGDE